METVYRVEHRENREGPYGSEHSELENMIYAHNSDTHPGPRNPISGMKWEWSLGQVFGFRDREQLDAWFKGWKKRLHRAGYVIREYSVPSDAIVHGHQQLCFWPDKAEELAEYATVRRLKL